MLMAWIESHQSLSRHRKTLKTAGRLSVDRHKLIGHLHELWWWALDNVGVDGQMTGLTPYEISYAAQWDGDHEEFIEALIYGGFLDKEGDCYVLHDWYDYAGKLIERREQERERSRKRRRDAKKERDKDEEDNTKTTSGRPVVGQQKTVGTVPNRTVPNSTVPVLKECPDFRQDDPLGNGNDLDVVVKDQPAFDEGSSPYRAAMYLRERILANNPRSRVPPDNIENNLAQGWAKDLDLLNRLGPPGGGKGYSWPEIKEIIDFSQEDEFWKTNILSASKLRKQCVRLENQMKRAQERASPKMSRNVEAALKLVEKFSKEESNNGQTGNSKDFGGIGSILPEI